MKLFFRLLWLVLTQSRRPRCELIGPCETAFRVLPNDLDVFMHMNNGVYFTIADLARTDLMMRSDMAPRIRERGWYPVVANETMRFRKSLKLWQRFTITTRVLGWTDRSIYLEQVYRSRGESIATAIIDARFLSRKGGVVPIPELMDLIGMHESPELPGWIEDWTEGFREHTIAEGST